MMVDGGYQSLRNILQFFSFKLSPIICEDPPGYAEPVYDTLHELDCCFLCDVYHWYSFHPLDEHVDCVEHEFESSWCPG
jgi:hypothetical protein